MLADPSVRLCRLCARSAAELEALYGKDAMITEERRADAPGGSGHGYFPGGIYTYEKVFHVPEEWRDK